MLLYPIWLYIYLQIFFQNCAVIRGILSRSDAFDNNQYAISTVQDIAMELKPKSFWLNVQVNSYV